jgi:hypothetical protein
VKQADPLPSELVLVSVTVVQIVVGPGGTDVVLGDAVLGEMVLVVLLGGKQG